MAEQYEAERLADTWNEFDQWDIAMLLEHSAPSTYDAPVDKSVIEPYHRYPSTDDLERTPVLGERTPVLGGENTGTPVPPKSPIPLHESSLHPGGVVTLGDAHASDETPDGKIDPRIDDDPEWGQIYAAASEYLQALPDHGQDIMGKIREQFPEEKIDMRVYAAALAVGMTPLTVAS